MSTSGSKPTPPALPSSTSHPLGMSTDTIGSFEDASRGRAESNGARMGPLKEKPKIASRMISEEERASRRESTVADGSRVGIFMLAHCVPRRCASSSPQLSLLHKCVF